MTMKTKNSNSKHCHFLRKETLQLRLTPNDNRNEERPLHYITTTGRARLIRSLHRQGFALN